MGSCGPVEIAPGVHWYSAGVVAGNIYFVQSASSWVLIDTATAGQGRRIREAAEALFGTGARPAAILLTHVHPDHSGSALELARAWDCPVYLHPAELDLAISRNLATVATYANPLDRWIILPLLRLFPRRRVEAMMEKESLKGVVSMFEPEAAPPGLPEWTSMSTPGHSPGHTAFFRRDDRVLIAGDALLTVDLGSLRGVLSWIWRPSKPQVSEPPWYTNWDRSKMAASASVIVQLQPRVLAPGHGQPLCCEAATSGLRAYALTQGPGTVKDRARNDDGLGTQS